jgi:hypothetical protein
MTYIPDLSIETYNEHKGLSGPCLSVGWLGAEVLRAGDTTPAILEALFSAKASNQLPDDWLGYHTCEICNNHEDRGEFFITDGSTRYILPNMVTHYIQEHGYKLPDVVEKALYDEKE